VKDAACRPNQDAAATSHNDPEQHVTRHNTNLYNSYILKPAEWSWKQFVCQKSKWDANLTIFVILRTVQQVKQNVVAFLFGVILLVITLWLKVEAQKFESPGVWEVGRGLEHSSLIELRLCLAQRDVHGRYCCDTSASHLQYHETFVITTLCRPSYLRPKRIRLPRLCWPHAWVSLNMRTREISIRRMPRRGTTLRQHADRVNVRKKRQKQTERQTDTRPQS